MPISAAGHAPWVSSPAPRTRFGRDFTARVIPLGGVKVKRRDRAYYHGVMFKAPGVQETASFRAAA